MTMRMKYDKKTGKWRTVDPGPDPMVIAFAIFFAIMLGGPLVALIVYTILHFTGHAT